MKKAIFIAVLAFFVAVANLLCAQTVALASSGLFLHNNKTSEKAQKFIAATQTKTNLETDFAPTEENSVSQPMSDADHKQPSIDEEGSLPLFTKIQASGSKELPPSSDGFIPAFSLITSLLGLIVIAFAASWFIQKKTGFSANNFGKTLGIVPLDNKRLIYIVDIMGKVMVLGVTENNINFLTEITDKDTIDAYRLKYGQSVTPGLEKLFPFIKTDNAPEKAEKETEEKMKEERKKLNTGEKEIKDRLEKMLIK